MYVDVGQPLVAPGVDSRLGGELLQDEELT